jgi:hypothetical protein
VILNKVDLVTQTHDSTNIRAEPEDEFRVCKGNYIGVIRPTETQYEFLVSDMRREEPTIHGGGVDIIHATAAVMQLLDALIGEP